MKRTTVNRRSEFVTVDLATFRIGCANPVPTPKVKQYTRRKWKLFTIEYLRVLKNKDEMHALIGKPISPLTHRERAKAAIKILKRDGVRRYYYREKKQP